MCDHALFFLIAFSLELFASLIRKVPLTATILYVLFFVLILFALFTIYFPVFFGAPWHPTPSKTIKYFLDLCEAKPGEKLYDLGSGYGRVLIMAARQYGLKCVGIEIDPMKTWISRLLIRRLKLWGSIEILRRSVFDFDYAEADILFIYMSHQALDRLFPEILKNLKPNAKIICYRFCPRSLEPTKVSKDRTIFFYQFNKGNRVNEYS